MLSWCDSDKKQLRADIRDPTNDQSFTYELKHTRAPKQDEREFCQDFAERIERNLGRRVEYSMPGQSKGAANWSRISTKQVLIAGAALFAIGALAHLTGFDMKLIGLSVQMWCLILYAILLVGYFKHHSGKIGQALTILYWCFTLLVCVMQVNTWITNNSFTFFKPPFAGDSTSGAVDTSAGKPSSGTTTEEVKREPFLQSLKRLGEFEEKQVSGTGDSVIPIPCYPMPCLINITHSGDGNFAVKSYDTSGNYTDLLVNTIGFYAGQVTTYFDYAESAMLEIKANGNWSMTFKPMSAMTRVVPNPAEEAKGGIYEGDYVVYVDDEPLKVVGFVHRGSSNFSVKAVAPTETKLLVNTIDEYKGTVIWDEPQSFYVVHADGRWAIAW